MTDSTDNDAPSDVVLVGDTADDARDLGDRLGFTGEGVHHVHPGSDPAVLDGVTGALVVLSDATAWEVFPAAVQDAVNRAGATPRPGGGGR